MPLNDPNPCKRRNKKTAGLTRDAERRLKLKLRAEFPSEPWLDAQFVEHLERDERGRQIVRRAHDPTRFPPGGNQTAMVRCPACKIFNPPNSFEDGVCLDHADEGAWGPSPSAVAIQALQWRNLRLPESELAPESTKALREEIQRQSTLK